MNDDKRFILAIALSVLVLVGFQYYRAKTTPLVVATDPALSSSALSSPQPLTNSIPSSIKESPRAHVLLETPRVSLENNQLRGSINLHGALIDDMELIKYRQTTDPQSSHITLLSPRGSEAPFRNYEVELGFSSEAKNQILPTRETLWQSEGTGASPEHPIDLFWKNGKGLTFERRIAVDDEAMLTITDRVRNETDEALSLRPYGVVMREGDPNAKNKSSVIHEGPLGSIGGHLEDYKYAKMAKEKSLTFEGKGGWLGITDKYWLVALIPSRDDAIKATFSYEGRDPYDSEHGQFRTVFYGGEIVAPAHGVLERTSHVFIGAKRVTLLDHYSDLYDIPNFDRAIDFGWFYFLTKPFLYLLDLLGHTLGSLGIAILIFTVMLKLITLPLSLKSYHAMAKMKLLQPEYKRLQDRFKDDKAKLSQEMMALYAREKVSPVSGCLPTLIQIPIFFALYKVLYVSIEMRQAPFFGWIKDMSIPDPTSVFTALGMIPWTPPSMLQIGVWPILMGLSMFLQQKLSPQPPDKAQAQMFALMPVIMTFTLASMPAGLVIYWTWSNLLGIAQQWFIMRRDTRRAS